MLFPKQNFHCLSKSTCLVISLPYAGWLFRSPANLYKPIIYNIMVFPLFFFESELILDSFLRITFSVENKYLTKSLQTHESYYSLLTRWMVFAVSDPEFRWWDWIFVCQHPYLNHRNIKWLLFSVARNVDYLKLYRSRIRCYPSIILNNY